MMGAPLCQCETDTCCRDSLIGWLDRLFPQGSPDLRKGDPLIALLVPHDVKRNAHAGRTLLDLDLPRASKEEDIGPLYSKCTYCTTGEGPPSCTEGRGFRAEKRAACLVRLTVQSVPILAAVDLRVTVQYFLKVSHTEVTCPPEPPPTPSRQQHRRAYKYSISFSPLEECCLSSIDQPFPASSPSWPNCSVWCRDSAWVRGTATGFS